MAAGPVDPGASGGTGETCTCTRVRRFAGMHAQAHMRRQECGTTAPMPTLCDQAPRIGPKAPT
eukprot:2049557-Alexandrium_andersonii.AAC.1